jgi:hypothetical protein
MYSSDIGRPPPQLGSRRQVCSSSRLVTAATVLGAAATTIGAVAALAAAIGIQRLWPTPRPTLG